MAKQTAHYIKDRIYHPKEPISYEQQSELVYEISVNVKSVHRYIQGRIKSIKLTHKKGRLGESELAEHSWNNGHHIKWNSCTRS